MQNLIRVFIFLISATLLLSGCGGGSSGGGSDNADNTPDPTVEEPVDTGEPSTTIAEGRFLDGPVEGLTYISGDITGVTDSDGTFRYYVGETLVLKVGDIELGTTMGAEILTPIDLVPDAEDENDDTVINILRFLQTLDADGDPENGITISALVTNYLTGETINFEQTIDDFEVDENLLAILNALPLDEIGNDRELVDSLRALYHFRITLAGLEDSVDVSDMIPISESEVKSFQSVGVWRQFVEVQFESTTTFTTDKTYVAETTAYHKGAYVNAVIDFSAGSQTVDSCYVDGPEVLTDEADDIGTEGFCDDETVQYYRSTDSTEFKAVISCGGAPYGQITLRQLSTDPAFSQGILNIASSIYADIESSGEVCGSVTYTATTTTIEPELEFFPVGDTVAQKIVVRAPYDDNYLWLEFTFAGEPSPGVYTVKNSVIDLAPSDVSVAIHTAATEMGGAPENVEVIFATGGTLTLESLGDINASGSFSLSMDNTDTINGNFQLIME